MRKKVTQTVAKKQKPSTERKAAYQRGQAAEQSALDHLRRQGLTLLERNYRTHTGEIDLILQATSLIVFVEVRYRSRIDYGNAAESITATKQQRLRNAAAQYLQANPGLQQHPCRFDAILVSGMEPDFKIEWLQDAFQ